MKAKIKAKSYGKDVAASLYVDNRRKGTESPQAWYWKVNNRWITEFERRIRREALEVGFIEMTTVMMHFFYGEEKLQLKNMRYKSNPWLALIPRDKSKGSLYHKPVRIPL